MRASHLPTALRTSALSLLGQVADTSDLALLPYAADLTDAMVQLLQIESVRAESEPRSSSEPETTMDDSPAANDAKLPPFRRASLHFLALLARAYTRQAYEDPRRATSLSTFPMERVETTLGYIAATDADDMVRVMAREVIDALQEIKRALQA